MNSRPRVLFHWPAMGPYHFARMQALAQWGDVDLHVVESTSQDDHQWVRPPREVEFSHATLSSVPLAELTPSSVAGPLEEQIRDYRPDILVASGYTGRTPWKLLRRFKREGGSLVFWSESTRVDRTRTLWREMAKSWVLHRYDGAIVAGQPQRRYLRELGMADERIGVVGAVVDNDFFQGAAERCRSASRANCEGLNLPANYFLYVGRFIREKNLMTLLRAYREYRQIASLQRAWDLVLVGGGSEEDALKQFVNQVGLEGVHFAGIRQAEELASFYAMARCFVLPSMSEPWGLVVNEAMSASLPVLVSRHCGCAEDLVEDGLNGSVFAPSDETGLAAELESMSNGSVDLEAMGRRSLEKIQEFSPRRYAERVGHFFTRLRAPAD